MQVHEVADVDVASPSRRALAVEVPYDIRLTSDVEVAVDAPADTHATVDGRRHQQYATCPTGGVERLVKAVVATLCTPT